MKKIILLGMFFGVPSFCSFCYDNQSSLTNLTEFQPVPSQTQKIGNNVILKSLSGRTEDPKTPIPSSQSDGNIIGTAVQQIVNVMNHYGYTLRRSQSSENLRQLFDDLTREAQANND